jgi:hypothetical protein
MQSAAWIALIRRLPVSQHDNIQITTTLGTEIVVQAIVRLEREFMVLRGRMAGTLDAGAIIALPYDQIGYFNFIRKMTVDEAQKLFGDASAAAREPAKPTPLPGVRPGKKEEPAEEPFVPVVFQTAETAAAAETTPETGEPEPAAPAAGGKQPVSKSMMLARLRARLAEQSKSSSSSQSSGHQK